MIRPPVHMPLPAIIRQGPLTSFRARELLGLGQGRAQSSWRRNSPEDLIIPTVDPGRLNRHRTVEKDWELWQCFFLKRPGQEIEE
jgi:hypothetical protein